MYAWLNYLQETRPDYYRDAVLAMEDLRKGTLLPLARTGDPETSRKSALCQDQERLTRMRVQVLYELLDQDLTDEELGALPLFKNLLAAKVIHRDSARKRRSDLRRLGYVEPRETVVQNGASVCKWGLTELGRARALELRDEGHPGMGGPEVTDEGSGSGRKSSLGRVPHSRKEDTMRSLRDCSEFMFAITEAFDGVDIWVFPNTKSGRPVSKSDKVTLKMRIAEFVK